MDRVFDDIARSLAATTTRRQLFGVIGGVFATAFFAMFEVAPLSAHGCRASHRRGGARTCFNGDGHDDDYDDWDDDDDGRGGEGGEGGNGRGNNGRGNNGRRGHPDAICCPPGTCCTAAGRKRACCSKGSCVCKNGTCAASTGARCPGGCSKC